MTTEGWIFMVGFRVFDVGLLVDLADLVLPAARRRRRLARRRRRRRRGPGPASAGATAPAAAASGCRWAPGASAAAACATTRAAPASSGAAARAARARAGAGDDGRARRCRRTATAAAPVIGCRAVIDFGLVDEPVDERTHVVSLRGEIDALTAPKLGSRLFGLAEEGKRAVVVDLSEVTFMDSTGIGVLLNALRHFDAAPRRRWCSSARPSGSCARSRSPASSGHLTIFDSREKALGGLV